MSPHARSSEGCKSCAAFGAARRNSIPARNEIAAIDALVSRTAAAWSSGNPAMLRVSSRNDCRSIDSCSSAICVEICGLDDSGDDLADAALQLAVVRDRRAHRDLGGIDWRNTERDELGRVD